VLDVVGARCARVTERARVAPAAIVTRALVDAARASPCRDPRDPRVATVDHDRRARACDTAIVARDASRAVDSPEFRRRARDDGAREMLDLCAFMRSDLRDIRRSIGTDGTEDV
jgi:hypothetical protein